MAEKIIKKATGFGLNKQSYEQDGKPHPHPQVEDLVNTIGFSLVKELIQYLKGPEGTQALECILDRQSRVVSKLATTQEAREAMRAAAAEAVVGSYDAAQRKWADLAVFKGTGRSGIQYVAVGVIAAYILMLAVGLLLTLWRFAFFGLH